MLVKNTVKTTKESDETTRYFIGYLLDFAKNIC